jgi:hypothetical protein
MKNRKVEVMPIVSSSLSIWSFPVLRPTFFYDDLKFWECLEGGEGNNRTLAEGRRKKEERRRKKEEGRRKKEEGRRKKEEGRRKKEEGRRKKEEGRDKINGLVIKNLNYCRGCYIWGKGGVSHRVPEGGSTTRSNRVSIKILPRKKGDLLI